MRTPINLRIKELRNEQKLTQQQFGELLHVSQDTISLWEKGKSCPSAEQLVLLTEIFNVSGNYILGLEDY